VSPGGHEVRILQRIEEIVREVTGKTPELAQVLPIYADCLDLVRERMRESERVPPPASAPPPASTPAPPSTPEDRRALAQLARLELTRSRRKTRFMERSSRPCQGTGRRGKSARRGLGNFR
jgi:hypothetical protein